MQMTDLLEERRRLLLDEIRPEHVFEKKDFELNVLMHQMVDQKTLSIEELKELKGHIKEIDEWLRRI
jgi:hypothetical protein